MHNFWVTIEALFTILGLTLFGTFVFFCAVTVNKHLIWLMKRDRHG